MEEQIAILKELRALGASKVVMRGKRVESVEFFETGENVSQPIDRQLQTIIDEKLDLAVEDLQDELDASDKKAKRDRRAKQNRLTYGHAG